MGHMISRLYASFRFPSNSSSQILFLRNSYRKLLSFPLKAFTCKPNIIVTGHSDLWFVDFFFCLKCFACRSLLVPELPSTAQPKISHSYYKRPRLGASAFNTASKSASAPFGRGVLRNWPNSVNLNESPSKAAIIASQSASALPRQRSVTFEPQPGSAPGDTEYEETETDDIISSYSPTTSPVGQERGYTDMHGESIGILESAARLANSAERYDKASRRQSRDSRRSSVAVTEDDVLCPADEDSLTEASDGPYYSDDESVSVDDEDNDAESVNSEPVIGRTSVSARASKTSLIASPLKSRKSGDAGSRRISREASALLDFDCPPTPINEGRRLSRTNTGKLFLSAS